MPFNRETRSWAPSAAEPPGDDGQQRAADGDPGSPDGDGLDVRPELLGGASGGEADRGEEDEKAAHRGAPFLAPGRTT